MRYLCALVLLLSAVLAAAPGDETTFEMQWQKDCFRRTDSVEMNRQEPFATEPDTQDRGVERGVWKIGPTGAQEDIGLLWDNSEGKLYVDLNRDGDLTNDPNSVFTSVPGTYVQTFDGLEFTFQNENGRFRYQCELSLYRSNPYHWGSVKSGYSGTCELNGAKWTIQANDAMNTRVEQGDLFSVVPAEGGNGILSGSLPKSLFFGGRLYDISFEFKKAEDGFAHLWCTLKERAVPLGTLVIKGQWIDRLVLGDEDVWIVPERSDQPGSVPAGTFGIKQFALKYAEDKPAVTLDRVEKIVSVADGGSSELVMGGPLKSSVDVNRQGRLLEFSYKLVGSGGEQYSVDQITGYDRSKPPTVAIYKGDMQLAAGTFEFG